MGDDIRKSGDDGGFSDFFGEDDFFGDEPVEGKPRSEPESKPEPEPEPEPEPAAKPKADAGHEAEGETKPVPKSKQAREARPATVRTGGARPAIRYGVPIAIFFLIAIASVAFAKPSGESLLTTATKSFGKIDRGTFDFAITISPKGGGAAQPASVSLSGPFELKSGQKLPTAHIDYTVNTGGQEQTQTLIFTGGKAYFVVQGQAYEMPAGALKQLQTATADLGKSNGKSGGLAGVKLNFDKWLTNPKVSNGGVVGGQKTWQIDGDVDVVAALTDLIAQSKALGSITGQQLPAQLSKKDAAQLRKSINQSFVRVNVGRYDHLLRRLDLTMDVSDPSSATKKLSGAQAALASGRVNVVIGIDDPNQPIKVEAPPNALPYSALQSLTGGGATDQTGK